MPNHFYTYILNIYDLVWFSFMAYQPLGVYLMPIPFYTYILNIWLILLNELEHKFHKVFTYF